MKLARADYFFQISCFIFLGVAGLMVLYPLVYVISSSLSSTIAIATGQVILWPVGFNTNSYRVILGQDMLRSGFFNSLIYVAGGTTVRVALILLAAYPLSRRDLPGRKFFLTFYVITMFFSGGLVPTYILMRNLGLVGTRWALIAGAGFSCYFMIIVKTYFQNNIPSSLLDAAHIDGCGDVAFFFLFALPLAVPVIAVMVLFNSVGIWNSYFSGMIYLTRPSTFNFQMVLRDILFVSRMALGTADMVNIDDRLDSLAGLYQQIRYSVLVIGAFPMMVLYPFIQKFFIRGLMIGSLKE